MNTSTVSPCASDPSIVTLRIPEGLSIYSVEAVRAACLAELTRSSRVALDLGGVSACDSIGVQVLVSAQRSATNAGKTLRFVNVPAAVSQAAERVGCVKLFSSSSP